MQCDWILRDVVIVRPEGRLEADVALCGGKVALIAPAITCPTRNELAGKGRFVIPGLVDPLVHLSSARGLDATVRSASWAAIRGGITTLLDLGDATQPLTTEQQVLERRDILRAELKGSFGLIMRARADNLELARQLAERGLIHGIQVDPTDSSDPDGWERLVERLWHTTDRLLYVQPDEPTILQAIEEGLRVHDLKTAHHRARPVGAALQGINALFEVLQRIDSDLFPSPRVLIPQISSGLELRLLRFLARPSVRVGVGAAHLALTQRSVRSLGGEHGKILPPLRLMGDQRALRKALRVGQVSFLTSAHQPVERWEKELPYWDAPCGMPMLSMALRVYLSGVSEGWLTLEQLVRLGAEQPARLLGLGTKGRVEEGLDGDLVLLSDDPWTEVGSEEDPIAEGWSLLRGRWMPPGPAGVWVGGERVL